MPFYKKMKEKTNSEITFFIPNQVPGSQFKFGRPYPHQQVGADKKLSAPQVGADKKLSAPLVGADKKSFAPTLQGVFFLHPSAPTCWCG